jgi:small subunit ribosomal protein S1
VKTAGELFAVGDLVSAVIKSVDQKARKIRLSIKDFESQSTGGGGHSINQYLNNRENVSSSLGKALADVKILNTER